MFCGICFDLRQNPDCTVAIFICLNVRKDELKKKKRKDELNKWENETEKKKKKRVRTQQHKARKWKTDNNTNYSSIPFD